jgi:hypothetical protein
MKLRTADLKSFKSNSAGIKANTILPILSYLKFEKNKVTKNALNSFIIQDMPGATDMLVDEKTLWSLVDKTKSETIDITQKDGRVTITDGTYKPVTATDSIDTYPVAQAPEDKWINVSGLLADIKTSSAFVDNGPIEMNRSFIYIGRNRISATDANIMYYKQIEFEKEIILRKETALTISRFNNAEFSDSDSYHFFKTGTCIYGFSKPEATFFDMSVVIVKDYNKLPSLTVDKSPIIEFNEMCQSMCPAKFWLAQMTIKKDSVGLYFNDTDFEQENDVMVSAEVNKEHDVFKYNCVLLNQLLKNLPDQLLTLYRYKSMYFVEGLGGYTAVIMGLVN